MPRRLGEYGEAAGAPRVHQVSSWSSGRVAPSHVGREVPAGAQGSAVPAPMWRFARLDEVLLTFSWPKPTTRELAVHATERLARTHQDLATFVPDPVADGRELQFGLAALVTKTGFIADGWSRVLETVPAEAWAGANAEALDRELRELAEAAAQIRNLIGTKSAATEREGAGPGDEIRWPSSAAVGARHRRDRDPWDRALVRAWQGSPGSSGFPVVPTRSGGVARAAVRRCGRGRRARYRRVVVREVRLPPRRAARCRARPRPGSLHDRRRAWRAKFGARDVPDTGRELRGCLGSGDLAAVPAAGLERHGAADRCDLRHRLRRYCRVSAARVLGGWPRSEPIRGRDPDPVGSHLLRVFDADRCFRLPR